MSKWVSSSSKLRWKFQVPVRMPPDRWGSRQWRTTKEQPEGSRGDWRGEIGRSRGQWWWCWWWVSYYWAHSWLLLLVSTVILSLSLSNPFLSWGTRGAGGSYCARLLIGLPIHCLSAGPETCLSLPKKEEKKGEEKKKVPTADHFSLHSTYYVPYCLLHSSLCVCPTVFLYSHTSHIC